MVFKISPFPPLIQDGGGLVHCYTTYSQAVSRGQLKKQCSSYTLRVLDE